jgi:hypothetical protein
MSNIHNYSHKSFLSKARKKAFKKASKEISHVFEESNLNLWFKISKGETYTRFLIELRPAYRRMLEHEYLIYLLNIHIDYLMERRNYLGAQAGKLKAGIKSWETDKAWQSYSRANVKLNFFDEKLLNNKKGFINSIYSFIFRIKSDDSRNETNNNSKILISHNRINFNWFYSICNYSINFFYFLLEWSMKSGLSIITAIGLIGILEDQLPDNKYLVYAIALFSSVSLVQIISKTAYNFYISRDNQKKSFMPVLLFLICIMEGILGYSTLKEIFSKPVLSPNAEPYNLEFFVLSMSFSSANILFSIAKATRYTSSLLRREKFLSLVEQRNDVSEEINYISGEIERARLEFERYKVEVQNLLYGKDSQGNNNGIFPEISQLSKEMYGGLPKVIPLSSEDVEQLPSSNLPSNGKKIESEVPE